MKYIIISLIITTSLSLAQEKAYLSHIYSVAQPAVEMLVENHDVDALVEVVEISKIPSLKLSAISAIGIPNNRIATVFLQNLRKLNTDHIIGGSESVFINGNMKMALMNALAPALNLKVPQDYSVSHVADFIAQADQRIKEMNPAPDHVEKDHALRVVPNDPATVHPPTRKKTAEATSIVTSKERVSTPWLVSAILSIVVFGMLLMLLKRRS
jgi:hypothetical protein